MKKLCLILTDKCNAQCKTCCFSCSPKNSAVMDEGLMLKAIDEACETGDFNVVGFSGGEPFLYYELLKRGAEYAKQKGLLVTAATNGFWGAWSDEELQQKLDALQLDHLSISYDPYHGEFVSEETYKRAISAAKVLKISYDVCIGETKDKKVNDLYMQLDTEKYLTVTTLYPYARIGGAKRLPEDIFYRFKDTDEIYCNGASMIAVRYDGEVFPCCSQPVFDTALSLGNLNERSLKDILENSETAKLCKIIRDPEIFTQLKNYAADEMGMVFPEKCTTVCEICAMMFSDKDKADRLAKQAQILDSQKTAEKFLNRRA